MSFDNYVEAKRARVISSKICSEASQKVEKLVVRYDSYETRVVTIVKSSSYVIYHLDSKFACTKNYF